MNESKISVRYAKALFQFAVEKKKLEAVRLDLELILKTSQIPEFDLYLLSPITRVSDKKKFLKTLFAASVTPESMNFLELLVTNKREAHIAGASRYFLTLFKKHAGIKSVDLISAKPLSAEHKNQIVSMVKAKTNAQVELTEHIDPSLLGGYIMRMDDQQYDASVSSKLKHLHQTLLETPLVKQ